MPVGKRGRAAIRGDAGFTVGEGALVLAQVEHPAIDFNTDLARVNSRRGLTADSLDRPRTQGQVSQDLADLTG